MPELAALLTAVAVGLVAMSVAYIRRDSEPQPGRHRALPAGSSR